MELADTRRSVVLVDGHTTRDVLERRHVAVIEQAHSEVNVRLHFTRATVRKITGSSQSRV